MGLGIVMAGLVWGLCRTRTQAASAYVLLATAAAMCTPIIRTAGWVQSVPTWPSWYIRPVGEHTTFTGFPWWGFVFAGGAAGIALALARERSASRRMLVAFAVAGAALVGLGVYTASLPTIYPASSFWTSSPTYFAIRLGVAVLVLAACYVMSALTAPWGGAGVPCRVSDRAPCSSTGFTSSSSTARWRRACATGCRSGKWRSRMWRSLGRCMLLSCFGTGQWRSGTYLREWGVCPRVSEKRV